MRIMRWESIGLLFTLIVGTLLHFVYQWTDSSWLAGIFAPVNESSWEHLKLVFTPMLLISVLEYVIFGRKVQGFVPIKVMSVLLAMAGVLILFYTYSGIIGINFLFADILTFVIAVTAAYRYSYTQLLEDEKRTKAEVVCSWITLLILLGCFVLFTFYPPRIGLFVDPVSGIYGIPRR